MAATAKSTDLVALVRGEEFTAQLALALPENMSPQRFGRAAVTALFQNPDIRNAEPESVLNSLLRAAQDGLLPDGREAALVIYGGKAQYLPMVGGFRKIAAEFGWSIRSQVVYEHDHFVHEVGLEDSLEHRPVRPGEPRGKMIAAYAVGQHRDGRRQFVVMYAEDIERVRKASRASSRGPWVDWTDRMYEKTVARRLFKELPLDPGDIRIARVLKAEEITDPVAALYGNGANLRAAPESSTDPDGPGTGDAKLEEAAVPAGEPAAVSSPEPEEDGEDGVWEEVTGPSLEEVAAAATTIVPGGIHKGKTLGDVAEIDPSWFLTQLKRVSATAPARPAIETFVAGRLPDVWATYEAWKAEQS